MAVGNMLVVIAAILEYLARAQQAQDKLDEAKEKMDKAAQELCDKWKGDGAAAFAAEQKVLYDYCTQLHSIGSEYITTVRKMVDNYSQMEEGAIKAIQS